MTELGAAYSKLVPWGSTPSDEILATLFDDATANDLTGPADGSKASSRNIRWFAGRMEALVGADGFAVGGKLSLADVLIFARKSRQRRLLPLIAQKLKNLSGHATNQGV